MADTVTVSYGGRQLAAMLVVTGSASSTPTFTQTVGAGSIATAQATATTSSAALVPARSGRAAVTIFQLGTTQVFLGPSGVTTSTGVPLVGTAGTAITIPTSAAVYGVTSSGSQVIAYLETF